MKAEGFSGYRRETASGARPEQLVMFLHGYGADGAQFAPIAQRWSRLLPNAAFVAPNGPSVCAMRSVGREWWQLTNLPSPLHARARSASTLIGALLDHLLGEYGLPARRAALVGFSQGAVLALYLGSRFAPALGAVISYAGVLVGSDELPTELKARTPTLLVQGDMDRMVPPANAVLAMTALRSAGVPAFVARRPDVAHEIEDGGVEAGGYFLLEHLSIPLWQGIERC